MCRVIVAEGADNITDINVKVQQANQSLGVVRLDWLEPLKPNGLVVTFHIQYKRIDIENVSFTIIYLSYLSYQYVHTTSHAAIISILNHQSVSFLITTVNECSLWTCSIVPPQNV